MGDNMQYYKYILRNVGKRHNRTVTFMPNQSSETMAAACTPTFRFGKTTNRSSPGTATPGSVIRSVFHWRNFETRAGAHVPDESNHQQLQTARPGFEAPVNLAYSARNRSAAFEFHLLTSPKAKRIEFRTRMPLQIHISPSRRCFLRGLDGIQNRMDPGDPLDKNLYELPPEELAQVASVPDSLRGAIEALQADHSFLLRGDVFNEDFIANWIDMKQKEYDALRLRPHPYEFAMYYDV
jgi:Glutamine synthetase